jgi:hypothetical protein
VKKEIKTISEIEELRRQHWQDKVNPDFQYRGIEVGYLFNPGVIYPTPMGQAIMPNLMHAFLYRGQNRDYPSFIPSIYRKSAQGDGFCDDLRIFYRELQLREFELLINRFPRVKTWKQQGFYVWSEAIAQHYGFYTTLLDITNNFDIALFFACCKYDTVNRLYKPLEESDLIGEENQYGVIYGKFNESIADMLHLRNIKPIGYQPFMRPNNQCGFVYYLGPEERTVDFDWKIKFKHNPNYAKKIFEEFDGGEKIFTKKDIEPIENEFQSIINADTYSEEAFLKTVDELEVNEHKRDCYIEKLKDKNIFIGKAPHTLTRQQIRQIDRNWSFQEFLKQCGIDKLYRLPQVKYLK